MPTAKSKKPKRGRPENPNIRKPSALTPRLKP